MSDLSRRSFLKGAAVSAAGVAAIGVVGCSSGTGEAGRADGASANPSWDEETDFVVVGAGLAGVSAAIAVATEGEGKHCLLLEKSPSNTGGGNSVYSGGWVLHTTKENQQEALEYLKELRGPFTTTTDEILETFAMYMADTREFLESLGAGDLIDAPFEPGTPIEERSSKNGLTDSDPEYPDIPSSKSISMLRIKGEQSSHIRDFMQKVVEDHSDVITLKTEAPVTSLIQDETTREILGVVYEEGGQEKKVRANSAVIMCLGGFEQNTTMMEDYLSMVGQTAMGGAYNTGDGFDMCSKVGAKMWHMNSVAGFWCAPVSLDGEKHGTTGSLAEQYGIRVGVSGRRFCFDIGTGVTMDWQSYADGETTYETGVGCRHGHTNYDGEWPHTHQPSRSWFIFDEANKIPALSGLTGSLFTEDPEADGFGYSADTLTELAEKLGLPKNELERTVKNWNRDCDEGFDSAFGRPSHWMTKVETGPFYAICLAPIFINTDGGPERNKNAQVLDLDGNPIPNLYSSGEFGSVWCNRYQGGGNLSECIAFSRIGVKHALGKGIEL